MGQSLNVSCFNYLLSFYLMEEIADINFAVGHGVSVASLSSDCGL